MTDVETAIIDPDVIEARAWAAQVGDQHYRADVEVRANGCEIPPPFLVFRFAADPGDTTLTVDNFLAGAFPQVALRSCEIVTAKLTQITPAEFVALSPAEPPPPETPAPDAGTPAPAAPMLAPGDFAGPNRAQRRAARRGRR